MGRKNSVAKILEALKELLSYFENLKVQEGNHIYDHLRDYRVLHFTFLMDDLLGELHTITTMGQGVHTTVSEMMAIISKVRKNLEALKTSCGTMENEFFKLLQQSTIFSPGATPSSPIQSSGWHLPRNNLRTYSHELQ